MLNKFGKRKKKDALDKFYTKPEVAKSLIDITLSKFPAERFDVILEPSAGSGAFLFNLPPENRVGLDISPDHESIEKVDFFEWEPTENRSYLVIGNPPFGRVSSMAVKFFQKSAK